FQHLPGFAARLEIVRLGIARAGEIDRQHEILDFRRLIQDAVRHYLVVGADLRHEPAQHDPVDDAERVIGDDDDGARWRQCDGGSLVQLKLQPQRPYRVLPKHLRRTAELCVVLVEPLDARLPADLLDCADQTLADRADLVRRVAEFRCGRHSFCHAAVNHLRGRITFYHAYAKTVANSCRYGCATVPLRIRSATSACSRHRRWSGISSSSRCQTVSSRSSAQEPTWPLARASASATASSSSRPV